MKLGWLILALYVVTPAVVGAQSPSLADVARQERARQKGSTSKLTVTNETLGTAAADPKPATPPAPAKAATDSSPAKTAETSEPTAASGSSPATPVPHEEKWWRDSFKTAREDMKRAEDRVAVLKLELNKLNMDLLTRDDIFNKEGQLGPKVVLKNAELTTAEKEADKARQKVTQLEDDLRKSGSPVGWSR